MEHSPDLKSPDIELESSLLSRQSSRTQTYTSWGAYEELTLRNGLVLHLSHFTREPEVDVWVKVDVGARQEKKEEAGNAHFLEHMILESTSPLLEKLTLLRSSVTGKNSSSNGATGYSSTTFQFKFPLAESGLIEDIARQLINPQFSDTAFQREKLVICNEHAERRKPELRDCLFALQAMYPDAGISHQLSGTLKTIKNTTADDLLKFHAENYGAERTTVFASGDLSRGNRQRLIDHFSAVPRCERMHVPFKWVPDETATIWQDPEAQRYIAIPRLRQRVDCGISFPLPSPNDPHNVLVPILIDLMSHDINATMSKKLRIDNGIGYTPIVNSQSIIPGHKFLSLELSVYSRRLLPKMFAAIREGVGEFTDSKLPEEMVKAACERVKWKIFDFCSGHHERVARSVIEGGRAIMSDTLKDIIDTVTPTEIQEFAQRVFRDSFVRVGGRINPLGDYRLFPK